MKKIVLLCAQGLSTGMLVKKMQAEALNIDYDCEIIAKPVGEAENEAATADCFLIGPQVRYELEKIRKNFPNVSTEVIDMQAYGRLDGKKVLEKAISLIEGK